MRIDVPKLQEFAESVLEACLRLPGKKGSQLMSLVQVEVNLISDRRMAELHQRFMKIGGPTDVITFQHGEIFVSVETARKQARRFGTSIGHELRLYLTHGLLHLHGFDDKPGGFEKMNRVQEQLVASIG